MMRPPSSHRTASHPAARRLFLRRSRGAVLALAGALALGGCSGQGSGSARVADHRGGALRLAPDPANTASRISVAFRDAGLQSAPCRFEWRRNGNVIADAGTDGLDPSRFSKNDVIAVTVTAPAPSGGKARTLQAEVRVVNTPPKLTGANLATSTASGAPVLQANVECADPDGDVPSYDYRWFKNGAPVDDLTGASLPLTRLARGDRVVVEVVARDDVSSSTPLRSDPYTVGNRPPQFSSQPNAPRSSDASFEYQAVAKDPDGDPLQYELVSGPAGMTVDPGGIVHWSLPSGTLRRGAFPVRIRATDSKGGEATQDFTIRLDPPPAKSQA
jgi:hypothetical protein